MHKPQQRYVGISEPFWHNDKYIQHKTFNMKQKAISQLPSLGYKDQKNMLLTTLQSTLNTLLFYPRPQVPQQIR